MAYPARGSDGSFLGYSVVPSMLSDVPQPGSVTELLGEESGDKQVGDEVIGNVLWVVPLSTSHLVVRLAADCLHSPGVVTCSHHAHASPHGSTGWPGSACVEQRRLVS